MLCRDKRPTTKASSITTNNSKLHSPLHVCSRQRPHLPPSRSNIWHCAHLYFRHSHPEGGTIGSASFQSTSIHTDSEVTQGLAVQRSKILMTAAFLWICKLCYLSFLFTMEIALLIFTCSIFSCDIFPCARDSRSLFLQQGKMLLDVKKMPKSNILLRKRLQVSCWHADTSCYLTP